MRICAVSFTHKLTAAMLAAVLALALVPADALAATEGSSESDAEAITSGLPDQSSDSADSVILREGGKAASPSVALSGAAEGSEVEGPDSKPLTLASGLAGKPSSFVNSDVALDGEPVIGSFTIDGLTFAVIDESHVELVGVAPSVILSKGSEAAGPSVTLSEAAEGGVVEGSNESNASEAGVTNLPLPEFVTYEGTTYTLTSINAYAFYLSGVADVTLPVSVNDVDDRAFRSSDVSSVTVAEGNPNYSSFDGALYDAEQLCLLLIPEGKQGTVRIPKTAEVAEASVFSHCPLVDSISVDAGSAAFASENGLLYTSDLTTLLRVPAGAIEITIREGCTIIAAGALEACSKLTTINAPATVTSISPDIFHAIPTVSLPIASLAEDAPQLTAMVALSSTDDDLPDVDSSAIMVNLLKEKDASLWQDGGFECRENAPSQSSFAELQSGSTYSTIELSPISGETSKQSYIYLYTANYGQLAVRVPVYYDRSYYWLVDNLPLNTFTRQGYTCTGIYDSYGNLLYNIEFINVGGALRERLYSHNDGVWWVPTGQMDKGHGVGKFIAQSDVWAAARLVANNYTLSFNTNGGSDKKPADVTVTFDSGLPEIDSSKPTKTGYTFKGWYDTSAATGGNMYYDANNKPVDGLTWRYDGPGMIYARWDANSYTVAYRDKADSKTLSTDTDFEYDTTRKLAAMPSSGVTPGYTAVGWAKSKEKSSADYSFGEEVKNLATSGTKYLYLAETPHTYTVTFDSAGGSPASDISATYDNEITLPTPTRQGYAFGGWKNEGTGTTYQAGSAKNLTTADKATVKLVAQWNPVISADVPQTVTARVDVLGIEDQAPATSYIESRCGEPLRVTEVGYARLSGATELFGDRASEVRLEAFANGAATPTFSLALKGQGYLADMAAFAPLDMEGYGARVPISYRFAIPDDLLPQLKEATVPICSVSYTVGLG